MCSVIITYYIRHMSGGAIRFWERRTFGANIGHLEPTSDIWSQHRTFGANIGHFNIKLLRHLIINSEHHL